MRRLRSLAFASWWAMVVLALLATGCGDDDASSDSQPVSTAAVDATSTSTSRPDGLAEGPVMVGSAQVSPGPEAILQVSGELPTACHQPSFEVDRSGSAIVVRLVSLVDADAFCAQAIEPFTLSIPLGATPSTATPVLLNGEQVGSIG